MALTCEKWRTKFGATCIWEQNPTHLHEDRCSEKKAKHFDDEKVAIQWVLSMSGLDDVANVGTYGAKKYGQSNWRGGSEYMRYLGSCARHICAVVRGQWIDAESKLPHLAHCAYNCLILLTWHREGVGVDDRPCLKQ